MKHLLASLAVLALASLAAAHVRVVSPTGPVTTIQAAIDDARDDDVILVKSGTYPSFVVRGKALVIAEDVGQTVRINGAMRVVGIDGTRTVTLMGLENVADTTASVRLAFGLRVSSCSGLVFLQDCTLRAPKIATTSAQVLVQPRPALLVDNSLSVVLSHCTVAAGQSVPGQSPNYPTAGLPYVSGVPSEGAYLANSGVSFFECNVTGGRGVDSSIDGSDGGHAIWAVASALFLSRTSVIGGDGGNGNCYDVWGCQVGAYAGDGGHGIVASSGTAIITRTTTPSGGLHGRFIHGSFGQLGNTCDWGSDPPCAPGDSGNNGQSVMLGGGSTRVTQAATTERLIASTIVRENASGQLTFNADAGATVDRWSSRVGIASYDPASQSIQVTSFGPSYRTTPVGVATGAPLLDPIPVPKTLPGGPHRLVFYQGAHTTAAGLRLGTPRALLMLDNAY